MTDDKLWLKADRYEHDTERWLRSQSKIYALRKNLGMAATFERCAEEVAQLRARLAEVEAQRDGLAHIVRTFLGDTEDSDYMSNAEINRMAREALAKLEAHDGK